MDASFQDFLLREVQKSVPNHSLLSQELMQLLRQSKANVYKKIKGEVPFSVEEAVFIIKHFNISVDAFLGDPNIARGKIVFQYSLPESGSQTPFHFLDKIKSDLEKVLLLQEPSILYASNELPLFHSLTCRNLLAFKLFVWARINWQVPGIEEELFDPEAFYARWPEVETTRQALVRLYDLIPGKEYWPRTVLENILNQIRYYTELKIFRSQETPKLLLNELRELLKINAERASERQKVQAKSIKTPVFFELFLNEIAYTNNIILILSQNVPVAVYTTLDNPNFIWTQDPAFCKRMMNWMKKIEGCSYPLSAEKHRLNYFSALRSLVDGALLTSR